MQLCYDDSIDAIRESNHRARVSGMFPRPFAVRKPRRSWPGAVLLWTTWAYCAARASLARLKAEVWRMDTLVFAGAALAFGLFIAGMVGYAVKVRHAEREVPRYDVAVAEGEGR